MLENILELVAALEYNEELINKVKSLKLKDQLPNSPYENLEALKNETDYRRFILSLYSLYFTYQEYRELKIPFHIFKESMEDFNLRAMKYYRKHQRWGIQIHDLKWLNFLFKLELFKLHTLRFQKFPMDYEEMEREGKDRLDLSRAVKERFPEGTPLINTHIETGTDLSDDSVEKSLILARSFFSEFFPDFHPQGFITRTWLLHPSLKELIPPETKILKFASRFEILGLSNNYTQALLRIYGSSDIKRIRKLKKVTTLQKGAYKIYKDLGVGIGFIKMDSLPDY